jgi:hypothetical protein
MAHILRSESLLDMGSVRKYVSEVNTEGESIISYDLSTGEYPLKEITQVILDQEFTQAEFIKLNTNQPGISPLAIIPIKDEEDNLFLGCFTDDIPNIDTGDLTIIKVELGHKYFSGSEWVVIHTIDFVEVEDIMATIKVADTGLFFCENILVTDYTI